MKRALVLVLALAALAGAIPGWAGTAVPGAQVRVVSPRVGSDISGTVEVVAEVVLPKGEKLDRVVVQTERGEQVRLARGVADNYSANLDTTRLRNGRQALVVIAFVKGSDEWRLEPDAKYAGTMKRSFAAETEVKVRNSYQLYWGDLRAHTAYSGGAQLPNEAFEYARNRAKLDFLAITDLSEQLTWDEYAEVISQADSFDQPGKFVALYGIESENDAATIGVIQSPTPCLPAAGGQFYQTISRMGLLGRFNHSATASPEERARQSLRRSIYLSAGDEAMAMVEVSSLQHETAFISLLDAGWHVGAAGGEIQPGVNWGASPNWTVALARELTKEGILEALRARRIYSSGDRNLRLGFTVDGEDMGARALRPAGSFDCVVAAEDPDASDVIDQIDLFVDGEIAATVQPRLSKYGWAVPVKLSVGKHYCFIRLSQTGNRKTWSSPVWVNVY